MTSAADNLVTTELPSWLSKGFKDFEASLNGERNSEVHEVRKSAFGAAKEAGFPTSRSEQWKYTNVTPVFRSEFLLASSPERVVLAGEALQALEVLEHEGPRVVFLNGFFDVRFSRLNGLEAGLEIFSLREALYDKDHVVYSQIVESLRRSKQKEHPFVALNAAFVQDGVVIRVAKKATIEAPVEIVFLTVPDGGESASYPRTIILAEDGASVSVIERFVGLGKQAYLTSPVTEVSVGQAAQVNHLKIQEEDLVGNHLAMVFARLSRDSRFSTSVFHFGGKLVRHEVTPVLDGEGCEVVLNGVTVIGKGQHVDNDTVIDHAKPHCLSNELYKGVFAGDATSAFGGTIIVRPGAQKTNAFQSNNNILLSKDATINTRPQLKIWADDVKCTHGATIGQLDEHALFYLRSRGIGKDQARNILIRAFIGEIVQGVTINSVRAYLEQRLVARLEEFHV